MLGQFIVPAAPEGLSIRAILRNTTRSGELIAPEVRRKGMSVDLRVFKKGELRFRDPTYAVVGHDGMLEISEATCAALRGNQSDVLVVARCTLQGDDQYFGQEHQLMYENRISGSVASLLYDQNPVLKSRAVTSPIILLAPKTWVGKSINSFVAFASTNSTTESGMQSRPLDVSILNQQGHVIYRRSFSLRENSTFLFDTKMAVSSVLNVAEAPKFFTVVAKGGSGLFAIMTFAVNESTGNFALEHSLPPDYYVSGDRQRIRNEALELGEAYGS